MLRPFSALLLVALLTTSCATHDGKSGRDLTETRHVRTTAYTHSEWGHRRWGRSNAIGSRLQAGKLNSAASDWSRFPLGTRFKVLSSGKEYIIDDYGIALVGTNTIDLYCSTRSQMRRWGVRHVDIEILELGDSEKSLHILKERTRYRHVRAMVRDLEKES